MSPHDTSLARLSAARLNTLFEITRKIVGTLDVPALLATILRHSVDAIRAERGLLALYDERTEDVEIGAVWNLDSAELDAAAGISRSTIRQILGGADAVFSSDAQKETRHRRKPSVTREGIQALLCVPLKTGERILGALYVDNRAAVTEFTDEARVFLEALANLAAIALQNARTLQKERDDNARLRRQIRGRYRIENLVGQSEALRSVLARIAAIGPTDLDVVIEGESGTGKELVAHSMHQASPRASAPFLAVNVAEYPEGLIESGLFGHRKGSFTGATSDQKGIFEEADGGTVFLDEIGSLPPPLQAKLLRVLQEKEVRRVGENVPRPVDVRVLCATNEPLASLVRQKRFREDLYFRLNVVTIILPPLRDRHGDIPLLAGHFLAEHQREGARRSLSPEARTLLESYPWPGNVRELENAIRRAIALCPGDTILPEHLGLPEHARRPEGAPGKLRETLRTIEEETLRGAMEESGGNVSRAAALLEIPRQQLQRLLKRHGIRRGS